MKRAVFGIFLPLLLLLGTGAAAQTGCGFGAFCGLSFAWSITLTDEATGVQRPHSRIRIYVGRDGRVFRENPNRLDVGLVCTREGATNEVTCQNGRCSNGSTANPQLRRHNIGTCTADLRSGVLALRFSQVINSITEKNESFFYDGKESVFIKINGNRCSVKTELALRGGRTDRGLPLHHYSGIATDCEIYQGNILAQ
jgi:hypothetical protein